MTLRQSTVPLDAGSIAGAQVLAVTNIDSPTELNSRAGGTNGALCIVTQNVAGANAWTIYCFDATSAASTSTPYIMAASGSGQWIAVAGRYCNSAVSVLGALGAGAPSVLAVSADGGASAQGWSVFRYDNTTAGSRGTVELGRARGSSTSPTATLNNDSCGSVLFDGYTGSFFSTMGEIRATASELWSGSNRGMTLALRATPAGGTSTTDCITLNGTTVAVPLSTASTSTTTGALTVAGGFGVAKDSVFGQRIAVAAGLSSIALVSIGDTGTTNPLTGTNQQGFRADITATSAATAGVFGAVGLARTAAASFTCGLATGGYFAFSTLGAGSTVTRAAGAVLEVAGAGTNKAGLAIVASGGSPAWTGTYAIRSESTAESLFSGKLSVANNIADDGFSVVNSSASGFGFYAQGGNTTNYSFHCRTQANKQVFSIVDTATAGQTAMLLYDVDNNTLERVTVGAADSGGVGFKVLRIPN